MPHKMMKPLATALVVVAASASVLAAASSANADPAPATPTPTRWTPSPQPTSEPNPEIAVVSVSPDPVVLRPHESKTVTVTVKTRDVKDIRISIEPGGGGSRSWPSADKGTTRADGGHVWNSWDSSSSIGWNDPEGAWTAHVVAVGADGHEYSSDVSFTVKHDKYGYYPKESKGTRIVGFDATPEPVRKGGKLTLRGEFQVAQCYGDWYYAWDTYGRVQGGDNYCRDDRGYWNDWHRLGGKDIGVYFRPKGSSHWSYVDTIQTDSDGTFSSKVRAYKSGTWGVRFNDTTQLGASDAYDYVKVIKH
ncbi:MAG: hypothetical protein JWQ95_1204 [Sphaerisporangium sp.]|nr:hypothetical protein [Sphaerisporangium sp.]